MNTALMLRVADYIEAHPTEFNMQTFGEAAQCGTIACIGGTTVMLERPELFLAWVNGEAGNGDYLPVVAAELLGLSEEAADHLFFGRWRRYGLIGCTPAEASAHLRELVAQV